jgi:3-mercaptopyruvate sulfurtransferase SseA
VVGHPRVAVYDGSWTEWAGALDTPIDEGGPEMAPHTPRRS